MQHRQMWFLAALAALALAVGSCGTLARDPSGAAVLRRRVATNAQEQAREREKHLSKARELYEQAAQAATDEGKVFRAYAIYKTHLQYSDKTAEAKQAVVDFVVKTAREQSKKDPVEALRVVAALQQTKDFKQPWDVVRPVYVSSAEAVWASVETMAANHHYVPAVSLARGIIKLDEDAPLKTYKQGLERIMAEGRAFHEAEAAKLTSIDRHWTRSFHQRIAQDLASRQVLRTTSNLVRVSGKVTECGFSADTLSTQTAVLGLDMKVNIHFDRCGKVDHVRKHMGNITYTEEVPVYRNEWFAESYETSGFIPSTGQTSRCIGTKNGRCTSWARVAASDPAAQKTTLSTIKTRRVLDHVKTVTRVKRGMVETIVGHPKASGTVTVTGPGVQASFPFGETGASQSQLNDRVRTAIEEGLRQAVQPQLASLERAVESATTLEERIEADIKWSYAREGMPSSDLAMKTFGIDSWKNSTELFGSFLMYGLPPVSAPEIAEAEEAKRDASSVSNNITSRGMMFDALREAGYVEASYARDAPNRYWPGSGVAMDLDTASSSLRGGLAQQRLHLRVLGEKVWEKHLYAGAPLLSGVGLGEGGFSVGGAYNMRAPLGVDLFRLGLYAQYEEGASPENEEEDKASFLGLGVSGSYDWRVGTKTYLAPQLRLNLLQLAGSGGPEGTNRNSEASVGVKYNLWRAWWLTASGSYLLGAYNSTTWTLGISFDPLSVMPIDMSI